MLHHIKIISVVFCIIFASTAVAQQVMPKLVETTYEVTKNGQPFATVHEQFIVTGNAYKVESITKGFGIYALFGERKLTSAGEVTSQGLKPIHFELHQGENKNKVISADFDWLKSTLHMLVKGNQKDAELTLGTQDLASYAYQFMFLPAPLKDAITVTLTTGKKLNQYQYKINADQEVIESSGAPFKTLHLVPSAQLDQSKPQTETKELWLASEHHYLPVRIMMIDETGAKIEQTLTELHVE